jgi:hypothetical protein
MVSTHRLLVLPSDLFPTNNIYTLLFTPIRATCDAHLILLEFIIPIKLGEEYINSTITYTINDITNTIVYSNNDIILNVSKQSSFSVLW